MEMEDEMDSDMFASCLHRFVGCLVYSLQLLRSKANKDLDIST